MRLFAGFGKRHVYLALGFCLVVEISHTIYAFLGQEDVRLTSMLSWIAMFFVLALLGLACAVAVDNLLGDTASTATRMVISMVVAALAATIVAEALFYFLPPRMALDDMEKVPFANNFHRILFRFSISAGWSLLLIALYSMLQASARARQRLHDMQLGTLAAERHVVEADLRAMQARVEPDLLFAALSAVDQAYARSVEEGERALDALIAFLRAALPAEPGNTSTVAAELDLVRAYVGVAQLLKGPKLELEITAEPATRANAMPAMLLLPLARWALDGAAAALQLVARQANGVLEISLRSDLAQAGASETQDIAGVRERLESLYGARARLEASAEPHGRRAFIALPV
ncbi:MAG TPA: histidine kinase [Burkholderiales bacterium]|nr:histidine kinase [Burkholderiales bacterium]